MTAGNHAPSLDDAWSRTVQRHVTAVRVGHLLDQREPRAHLLVRALLPIAHADRIGYDVASVLTSDDSPHRPSTTHDPEEEAYHALDNRLGIARPGTAERLIDLEGRAGQHAWEAWNAQFVKAARITWQSTLGRAESEALGMAMCLHDIETRRHMRRWDPSKANVQTYLCWQYGRNTLPAAVRRQFGIRRSIKTPREITLWAVEDIADGVDPRQDDRFAQVADRDVLMRLFDDHVPIALLYDALGYGDAEIADLTGTDIAAVRRQRRHDIERARRRRRGT